MLEICPISLAEANKFVADHHRHHRPVTGHKFSIGCTDGERIVGVAIVGRPVARYLDDGWTLEVNRCCTDGTRNACSILYAAAWRAARAMGYHKLITYILETEPGTSLKAAGWKCVGKAGGLRWTGKRRPEVDLCPAQMKIKFEKEDADKRELPKGPGPGPTGKRGAFGICPNCAAIGTAIWDTDTDACTCAVCGYKEDKN